MTKTDQATQTAGTDIADAGPAEVAVPPAETATADTATADTAIPVTPAAPATAGAASATTTGPYGFITTKDHKAIGRAWILTSLVTLAFVAVCGVLLQAEELVTLPFNIFDGINSHFQIYSLYRFALVLLVVVPLFVGLATLLVPLQIGATNIAFPRAANGTIWLFLIGAGITIVSVFAGGGWGAVDGVSPAERNAIALTLLGTALVIIALLAASVNIATTIVSLRTSGMTLMRLPLFAWSMLVACSVWMLTLPIALGNIALIYFDLHGGPVRFGEVEGSFAVFSQLGWLFEQPQVFAFAIPVLGIVGQVVPVVAGRRHSFHPVAMALIGLFGVFAVGGWRQLGLQGLGGGGQGAGGQGQGAGGQGQGAGGAEPIESEIVVFGFAESEIVVFGFALAVLVAALGTLAVASKTMMPNGPRSLPLGRLPAALSTHALGALIGILVLLGGAAVAVAQAIPAIGLAQTAASTAVLNLTLFGAVVAAIAALWFWSPKISGTMKPQGLGRVVVFQVAGGALLLGLSDLVRGLQDISVFGFGVPGSTTPLILAPSNQSLVDAANVVALIGAVVLALGVFAALTGLVRGAKFRPATEDNPFGGHTLEWSTTSPPPVNNFTEPPPRVISEAPLLDSANEAVEEA